ncbi:hypothetical protein Ato02nite_012070 [Paractinoplanes toevensis]|uniref:Uncharacterized protein n=1 Tax=Paractinoplanes toevensis TaxID=571911 RepID=A0A919T807_9ACTN|nr:hypothetical protein Ato02nite_012070 [Actinoplanes toevensis]
MSATPVLDFPGAFAAEPLFITGYKVGGGYDKNLPPCSDLWMTKAAVDNSRTGVLDRSDTPEQAYEKVVSAGGLAPDRGMRSLQRAR